MDYEGTTIEKRKKTLKKRFFSWVEDNYDGVFILYSNNSVSGDVNWTTIYSGGFSAATTQNFKVNITLDRAVRNHSIRAIVGYKQYTNITCGKGAGADFGTYSDTDDITFLVQEDTFFPSINFSLTSSVVLSLSLNK